MIASTNDAAFLMPLIHTIDSISRQEKLEGTGKIISLPPAFDMLADLSRVYHNKSGKTSHDYARLFASQALMPFTRFCSPASEAAQMIDWFLKSNGNSPALRIMAQNILTRTGADLKGNLASMDHDELYRSLPKEIEGSAIMKGGFPGAMIRNLAIALGSPTAKARDYSGEPSGSRQPSAGRGGDHVLPGRDRPESNEASNETKPGIQSTMDDSMSGALHSTNDTLGRNSRISKAKRRVVPRLPRFSKLVQHEKSNPGLGGPGYLGMLLT